MLRAIRTVRYDTSAVIRARETAGFAGPKGKAKAAELLGVTKRHYDRWEQAEPSPDGRLTRPNLDQLCALALLYNVPVGAFFADESRVVHS